MARAAVRSCVPYRVDLHAAGDDVLDRLVELGAIDAERSHEGGLAALMPDSVPPERLASALGVARVIRPRAGEGGPWLRRRAIVAKRQG